MENNEVKIEEETRFVIFNHLMASDIKIGRTVFEVPSSMTNSNNCFKDVIGHIAERQINKLAG
jgi:hypothetical protein